jgi:hypothetical protein
MPLCQGNRGGARRTRYSGRAGATVGLHAVGSNSNAPGDPGFGIGVDASGPGVGVRAASSGGIAVQASGVTGVKAAGSATGVDATSSGTGGPGRPSVRRGRSGAMKRPLCPAQPADYRRTPLQRRRRESAQ